MGCSLPAHSGVQEVKMDSGCVLWWGCFPQKGSGLYLGTHHPQKCEQWKNKRSFSRTWPQLPLWYQPQGECPWVFMELYKLWNFNCPFLVTFFNSLFHSLRQQPQFLEIMNSRSNSPSSTTDFTFLWQELFPSYTEILKHLSINPISG